MESPREQPRISVGSVADWNRIKANYTKIAIDSLDHQLTIAHSSSSKDAIRAHLQQFIDRTFAIAEPNLRVNGRSFESLDSHEQDKEVFDEALDRQIWSLADNRLQWDRQIAQMRQTNPKSIEFALKVLLDKHRGLDTDELDDEWDVAEDAFEDNVLSDRYAHIHEGFHEISALSEELIQTIPAQQERTERSKVAEAEVKALKS